METVFAACDICRILTSKPATEDLGTATLITIQDSWFEYETPGFGLIEKANVV